jgi:tetratricopeptide (TPR) repeat protein
MKRLNDDLDRMDLNLQQKTAEANEWARKYNELNAQFEETKKQLAAKDEDPTLVQTAQDLLHQGKLDEARKIYDRLIASDEENVDRAAQDYFERASILQLQFRMAEAMADYGKAFQYRPDNPRYAGGYARAARHEHRYVEAEAGWAVALRLYRDLAAREPETYRPNVAIALHNLGNLHGITGRRADAEQVLVEALTRIGHTGPVGSRIASGKATTDGESLSIGVFRVGLPSAFAVETAETAQRGGDIGLVGFRVACG